MLTASTSINTGATSPSVSGVTGSFIYSNTNLDFNIAESGEASFHDPVILTVPNTPSGTQLTLGPSNTPSATKDIYTGDTLGTSYFADVKNTGPSSSTHYLAFYAGGGPAAWTGAFASGSLGLTTGTNYIFFANVFGATHTGNDQYTGFAWPNHGTDLTLRIEYKNSAGNYIPYDVKYASQCMTSAWITPWWSPTTTRTTIQQYLQTSLPYMT